MEADKHILLEREGAIAIITVNNSQRANVLSRAIMDEIARAVEVIAADDTLRSAIITGAGERVFIGGADIRELRQLTAVTARTFIRRLHALIELWGPGLNWWLVVTSSSQRRAQPSACQKSRSASLQ
ncbi:MAG: hypothetical protein DMG78_26455 [Acidobacteria bacterium]|nr:MAG: hypothetical protein DMG78_26455 [Acidobacteriota bacterium]